MLDELLPYYEDELTHLRNLSKEFAARYPKIAARLQLDGDVVEDPHVERLIESFAFIAARIHKKLDDEFPQITEALLSILYPHFLRPVPSMSIAQLSVAPGVELSAMQRIERGTTLLTRPVQGLPVRYRSAWPVQVWPIAVSEAGCEPSQTSAFALQAADAVAIIRLRLQTRGQATFAQLGVDKLRFYLDGESPLMHALHEILLNSAGRIVISAAKGQPEVPPLTLRGSEHLRAVGFEQDEGLLDYDPRSFLGYRLIQEYFVLPEKFLFVELAGLDLRRFATAIDIRIAIQPCGRAERLSRLEQTVNADTFKLHCVPIVNLFKQQAEPIRLTHELHEYPVIPDVRRPMGLEVYAINAVRKHTRGGAGNEQVREYPPLFSVAHGLDAEDGQHWIARRVASTRPNDEGTDMRITLVDRNMDPALPSIDTLSLALTCTNRDLPSLLPFGGSDSALQLEEGGAVSGARLLKKPSATWRAPLRLASQWRLISHLALNHLSLAEGGREALLEILSLYNFTDAASVRKQIAGIVNISSKPAVTRVGQAPRQAFVRGTDITLTFDETQYVGAGIYVLARVLDHFFGLYCTANSWTRLTICSTQREEPLVTFAPRAGAQALV
ncbi:MAG: type VI secretion system baseplate subunit TssF [Pseudomonadales bacterium]|jgi:type VI secretion system protein ImpG|nr:type VI secretion system baseplate subunit TssF [Pseudomonadales bacterium]